MHLVATLCRHGRGALNAIEKFERTVPREERPREVATVVEFVRSALGAVEESLTVASSK